MNLELKKQEDNFLSFTVNHNYGEDEIINIISSKGDVLITMASADGKISSEKHVKDFKIKQIVISDNNILLRPISTKTKPIAIRVTETQYQTELYSKVTDTQIIINTGKGKEKVTLFTHKEETKAQTIVIAQTIEVVDTVIETTVTLATDDITVYNIFALDYYTKSNLKDFDINKAIEKELHDSNITGQLKDDVDRMKQAIEETLKSCDRVKIMLKNT